MLVLRAAGLPAVSHVWRIGMLPHKEAPTEVSKAMGITLNGWTTVETLHRQAIRRCLRPLIKSNDVGAVERSTRSLMMCELQFGSENVNALVIYDLVHVLETRGRTPEALALRRRALRALRQHLDEPRDICACAPLQVA